MPLTVAATAESNALILGRPESSPIRSKVLGRQRALGFIAQQGAIASYWGQRGI
ncbi:MAG: hypothetical protein ACFBSG_18370 [Leptolyngbyaceae cyanobacterium]